MYGVIKVHQLILEFNYLISLLKRARILILKLRNL